MSNLSYFYCPAVQLFFNIEKLIRDGSRHFHKGGGGGGGCFFLEKTPKTWYKKKNDKDKIGNILLKHVSTRL